MSAFNDAMKGATVMARRARMKARTEAWWHTEHCPNCRAKRELMTTLQSVGSMEGLVQALEDNNVKVLHVGKTPDGTKH